jgi:hypothetical protein
MLKMLVGVRQSFNRLGAGKQNSFRNAIVETEQQYGEISFFKQKLVDQGNKRKIDDDGNHSKKRR